MIPLRMPFDRVILGARKWLLRGRVGLALDVERRWEVRES